MNVIKCKKINHVIEIDLQKQRSMDPKEILKTDNVVYQDNQSAMLLEKNGKASSGKRTRHINIRYFFATDRINAKEMRVAYCPTGDMVADFFTKPLQGVLFCKLRHLIMNVRQKDGPVGE